MHTNLGTALEHNGNHMTPQPQTDSSSTVSNLIQRLQVSFNRLSPRDQTALGALGSFLALIIVIYGLWLPVQQMHRDGLTHWQQQRQQLLWLHAQAPAIARLAPSRPEDQTSSGQPTDDAPLLTRVTTSAKKHGIAVKRLQPEGDARLRLWLEAVDFNQTLLWLENAQQQGLTIDDISVDATPARNGKANIRLLLVKN